MLETLNPCALSPQDALAISQLRAVVWPPDNPNTPISPRKNAPPYQGPPRQFPATYIIRNFNGEIVAAAEVSPRAIRTTRGNEVIAALGGVCVRPDCRLLGYGSTLVRHCFDRIDHGDFSWALFQTSKCAFYEKLGCEVISNKIVNSLDKNPVRGPFFEDYAMVYPIGCAPVGDIDLLGGGY